MSCAVTRGCCANRSAWRVSIAGSVRSAGANNCDHCIRNADAESPWQSVHLAAEIACDDPRVVDEAGCRAAVNDTAGFEARSHSRRSRAPREHSARPAGSRRQAHAVPLRCGRSRGRSAGPGRGSARRGRSSRGFAISARPSASIWRSPPDKVPASWLRRSDKRGKRV